MFKYFIEAGRPKTLVCSMAPVILAFFLSKSTNYLIFIATLICSVLLQVLANWANDLYDFKKGADTNRDNRFVASGKISELQMKKAIFILLGIIILIGSFLTWYGGFQILAIGLLSITGAIAYTAGKYAFAYIGLGELAVLLFFGLIPAYGSFILFEYDFTIFDLLIASCPAFISSALIVCNNIRDIEDDKENNKKTIATVIGKSWSQYEYLFFIFLSGSIPVLVYLVQGKILTAIYLLSFFYFTKKLTDLLYNEEYEKLLPQTAKLNYIFIGIILLLQLIKFIL